jgi:hypothetical protein
MSKHHEDINAYLSQLRLELQGQPAGFIQDVLCDAESHLYDALDENTPEDIQDIINSYGSVADIASNYIQLEADTQEYLNGRDNKSPRFNGFFAPLLRPADYKSLGYFFIASPLSIAYFGWLVVFGVPSFLLSLVGIGIPLLALFLKIQCHVALFEGQLVDLLLGVRMPRRATQLNSSRASGKGVVQSAMRAIESPRGWKVTLYTLIQLPLSATYFCLGCLLFIGSLAVIATPVIDPIIHHYSPHLLVDIQWYWFPVTTLVGMVGLTLSLHISRTLAMLHSSVATYLLIDHSNSE